MRVTRSFKPSWILDLYTNPVRVSKVNETEISPEELTEFQRIIEMLLTNVTRSRMVCHFLWMRSRSLQCCWFRLTLTTQTITPFGSVKSAKLSWIQQALGSTNSRSAGMNSKGQGVNQPLLPSQLHST